MPLIRDYTHSHKMNNLSPEAERLFVRLLLKADCAGNFLSSPEYIKTNCFPLKTNIRTADILGWLKELSTPAAPLSDPGKHTSSKKSTPLLRMYKVEEKDYLHIYGYGQKLKYARAKFPRPPDPEVEDDTEEEVEENTDAQALIHPLQNFISENYKNVKSMKEQLTYEESERLVTDFNKIKIKEVLDAMENWAKLKNNLNVNKTIRNWMKRQNNVTTTIPGNPKIIPAAPEKKFTQATMDKYIGASIMVYKTKQRGDVTGLNGEKLQVIHDDQTKGEYLMNEVLITASAPRRNMGADSLGNILANSFRKG